MAQASTCYTGDVPRFWYDVTFIVNETGIKLTRSFENEYLARKFVNKLRHSKRCTLVSYPNFH